MRSSRLSWRSPAHILAVLALVAALGGAGCGAGATTSPAAARPTVSDAWVRMPAATGQIVAAYFTVANPGDTEDALIGVSSPQASGCMLHQTTVDASGTAAMHMVDRLPIPGGGMVKLEPGGYHLMMTGVAGLTVGSKVELDLTFERAGAIKVMAEVRAG